MNMSQAVSKMLKGSCVDFMFGIPGGGSSADLIQTSEDEGIQFILEVPERTHARRPRAGEYRSAGTDVDRLLPRAGME